MKDLKDQQIDDLKRQVRLLKKNLQISLNLLGLENVDENDLIRKQLTYDFIFKIRKVIA